MLWEAIYTLCLAPLLYVAVKYIISLTELKKYPPGPIPLPLIGNLHLIGMKPYESFKKLARTYGDVMSFSFGSQRIIVINGIHAGKIQHFNDSLSKNYCRYETLQGLPKDCAPLRGCCRGAVDLIVYQ